MLDVAQAHQVIFEWLKRSLKQRILDRTGTFYNQCLLNVNPQFLIAHKTDLLIDHNSAHNERNRSRKLRDNQRSAQGEAPRDFG